MCRMPFLLSHNLLYCVSDVTPSGLSPSIINSCPTSQSGFIGSRTFKMRKNLACMDWISACILTVSDFSQKSFPWKLLKVNAFKFLTLYNFFMCADHVWLEFIHQLIP